LVDLNSVYKLFCVQMCCFADCVLWVSLQLVTDLFFLLYFLRTGNEMGGVCSTYGGKERHIQGFGVET
jgi:hypothetical protein